MIAPLVVRSVNVNDTGLLPESFEKLMNTADILGFNLAGSYLTLDAGFDSLANKTMIAWNELIPVIKPNVRGTKDETKKELMSADFNEDIYKERINIERCFAWQDTYRKLVIRYEKLQATHLGFKYLAYSMINSRSIFGRKG